ncbi:hypothetical protein MMC21_008356 [Puttea exsequens]|nr:hypothetical protein [Puttea exsequens]
MKSDDGCSVTTISTGASTGASTGVSTGVSTVASSAPPSPLQSDFCTSPRYPPSEYSYESSRPHSLAPSSGNPRTPQNPPKKKSGFLTSLFTVKEPSAQALEDYKKQLMKQSNGRSHAVGLPGVSSAKLPPTVPRTNSKWDGVPHIIKEKEKEKETVNRLSLGRLSRTASSAGSSKSDVGASSSVLNSQRRHSQCTLGGTSAYSSSSTRLVDLYGWETLPPSSQGGSIKSKDSTMERPSASRAISSGSAPFLKPNTKFPPHEPPLPPKIVRTDVEQSIPASVNASISPDHSHSPCLTPAEHSPVTPDAPSQLMELNPPHLNKSPSEFLRSAIPDVPPTDHEVIVRSTGANVLGPPAVGRRPKPAPIQTALDRPVTSGNDFQLKSILKKDATPLKETPPTRSPLSSIFATPSPGKRARRNSAQDRLGLGMSLKSSSTAPPWASPVNMDGSPPKGERDITPTPEAGHSLRRKSRMSLFKK